MTSRSIASEPFDLPAFRDSIEALKRTVMDKLDFRALPPDALVSVHLALNALETARIHVEAARLEADPEPR